MQCRENQNHFWAIRFFVYFLSIIPITSTFNSKCSKEIGSSFLLMNLIHCFVYYSSYLFVYSPSFLICICSIFRLFILFSTFIDISSGYCKNLLSSQIGKCSRDFSVHMYGHRLSSLLSPFQGNNTLKKLKFLS